MLIKQSLLIHAQPADLFSLSQDYERRLQWDHFLKEARLLDPATTPDIGVKTYCKAWFGIGIETQYISFGPPTVVAVKMTRRTFPFREFAATWRFDPQDAGTNVHMIYGFKTGFALLDALVAVALRFEIRRRLRDLKNFAELNSAVKD